MEDFSLTDGAPFARESNWAMTRRLQHSLGANICLFAMLLSSLAPAAETDAGSADTEGSSERLPWQVSLTSGLVTAFGDAHQQMGDMILNEGPPLFLDVGVEPSYRVTSDFAFGLRANVGFDPGSRITGSPSGAGVELDRQFWQVGALGRYQAQPGLGPHVSVHVGAAALVDYEGDASYWQWVPNVGVAAGYDLSLFREFSLGLELRADLAPFGESSELYGSSAFYDANVWLGAALVASILP